METAAKIDAIESEMARDFMRPSGGAPMFSNSAANSTLGRLSQQPVEQPIPTSLPTGKGVAAELLDLSVEEWQGNANAIEIGEGSVLRSMSGNSFRQRLIEPAEAATDRLNRFAR